MTSVASAPRGPDVSDWQGGTISWKAVKNAGASFAFTKLSEGTGYVANTFWRNWDAIREANLARGAIHFARPDLGTKPDDEARFFLDHLPDLVPFDIVVLDLEVPTSGAGAQDSWALEWLQTVEHACGVRPVLYTGPWYAQGLGRLRDTRLAAYPLWNAAYQNPPAPTAYSPWQRVHLWQWTDSAYYPGIGHCDESIFLAGSLDDLKKLGKPAPSGAPHPVPPPPSLPHWKVTTPTHFRPRPQLDAMPLGPLLPAGTFVAEVPAPRGLPAVTGHWKYCRTGGNVRGYIFAPDLVPDPSVRP